MVSWIAALVCVRSILYSTSLVFTRPNKEYHEFFQSVEPQTTYDKQCQWTYNEATGGYAPVANEGRRHLAGYICAAVFRDMSDYVYSWPYHRFSEYDVWVADLELAARNLPPVSKILHVRTAGVHFHLRGEGSSHASFMDRCQSSTRKSMRLAMATCFEIS